MASPEPPSVESTSRAARLWGSSGACWLSGETDGPPDPQGQGAAVLADLLARELYRWIDVHGPALLGERSALAGFSRMGPVSCNGTSQLIRCSDGFLSFTLSRESDFLLLGACFEADVDIDPWEFVRNRCRNREVASIRERAILVGLSCAGAGEHAGSGEPRTHRISGLGRQPLHPIVVDLTALWAGPLAANLCGLAGARVVKVESTTRLDGTRVGSPRFFDLLHGGHDSVTIDFSSSVGIAQLKRLVSVADVVLTSARPRAFEQLGIDPLAMMAEYPISAWISISAFGSVQPLRIGYGDDAAIAGGLIGGTPTAPCYVGDAIADPLTGLAAAVIALDALESGARVWADLALADVARRASALGPRSPLRGVQEIRMPRARPVLVCASAPGTHNQKWLN